MIKSLKAIIVVALISLIPTLLIWLPFFLRVSEFWNIPLPGSGMATIVANYDGPLYIVVAKTIYNASLIKQNYQFPLPVEYYAAHFPLFPFLIRLLAPITGYPYAMLGIVLASSVAALYFFYKLALEYTNENNALFLTFVFSVFPARFLIVRSVGSPEPLFIAAFIASVLYFKKKKYLLAGIFGAIAQITKSPGILLFVAYALFLVGPRFKELTTAKFQSFFRSIDLKAFPILLMPISLAGIFIFYAYVYQDPLAYFHSGDNIHLFFPPFQIFNYSAPWVGTSWLEEIIFVYLFGALGFIQLIKKKETLLAFIVGVFFTTTIFVSHRDLIRYSLPVVPFIIIAFSEYISKREFKIVMAFLLIPIYLFSLAYISQNVMPISDWRPFL